MVYLHKKITDIDQKVTILQLSMIYVELVLTRLKEKETLKVDGFTRR